MIYNLVSSKVIIQKVFRDLKPKDSAWVVDAVEWIGEALEFIGYHGGFEKKAEEKTVADYRVALPCDLYNLNAVEYNGINLRFGTDVSGFDPANRTTTATPYLGTDVTTQSRGDTDAEVVQNSPTGESNFSIAKTTTVSTNAGENFMINSGYIVCPFEEGTIKLHYDAFPTDDDGYPKVPDNIVYKEAIQWYILRQMLMGGFKSEVFSYQYADQQWKKQCIAAGNDGMFPSISKMESFKNGWVRLVPNTGAFDDFFMANHNTERLLP